MKILTSTKDMTHEDWLASRSAGIGGSEIAAILGLNKWSSPMKVYLDKTGQLEKEQEQSEAAYWGNQLEEVVAKEFEKRTGYKVKRRNALLQHPEHEWMLGNVDRLVVGEKIGLECKTASEYLKNEWISDEVPASYLIQCQHYLAVTGYEAWYIAALIGGNKFIYKRIERDEDIIQHIIEAGEHFWNEHVLKNVPPEFDGSESSSEILLKLYPNGEKDSETELPDEADELINNINEAKQNEKFWSLKKTENENKLKALIGEFEIGISTFNTVTWKNINKTNIDSKKLKEEQPELFEKYSKTSSYRQLKIK